MRKVVKFLGVLTALLAMFGFGFAWRDLQKLEIPSGDAFLALVGADSGQKSSISSVQIFRSSYNRILERYAGEVNPKDLKYAGMEGMLASLGDPHTLFLPPIDSENFSIETTGKFVGVGAKLSPDPLGAKVAVVFEDGPAEGAGIKVGDYIIAVDGKSVEGVDISEIVSKIRGTEGTFVSLRVSRPGHSGLLNFRMRRAAVIAPSVSSKVIPGTEIGLITIDSFSETTGEQFSRHLARMEAQQVRGLIFDVRSNPGGLLDTAREILSHFVSDKVVVKMKMRGAKDEIVPSFAGRTDLIQIPTVTLIDGESASAAEIFAGALRDYRKTTLVGERTFGKSAVQNVFKLRDEASAKITIAKYLLPSGQDVGRKVDEDGQFLSGGLEPDIKVEPDFSKPVEFGNAEKDPQLQRAIDLLTVKLGARWDAKDLRHQVVVEPLLDA